MLGIFEATTLRTMSLAALALLASSAAAEARQSQGALIAPERGPVLKIDPARMPLLRERKQVFDIPRRMLTLASPPSWTAPASDSSSPSSALAIQRTRPMMPTPCATFYDYVDLTVPRRNGFRLVAYDVQEVPPPSGYTRRSPVEALAIDTSTRDTPTGDLPAAGQIRIRPPLHVRTILQMSGCSSRYRLSMTLEGPRGMDPFAGARGVGGWRDRR